MKTSQKIALGTLITGLLLCAYILLAPGAGNYWSSFLSSVTNHWSLASASLSGTYFIGAVVLFAQALPAFKTGMRRAYIFLIASIIGMTITFVGVVFMVVFNLTSTVLTLIVGGPPYIIGAILLYESMHTFARLINVKGLTSSRIFTLIVAILVAIVAYIVPYPTVSAA